MIRAWAASVTLTNRTSRCRTITGSRWRSAAWTRAGGAAEKRRPSSITSPLTPTPTRAATYRSSRTGSSGRAMPVLSSSSPPTRRWAMSGTSLTWTHRTGLPSPSRPATTSGSPAASSGRARISARLGRRRARARLASSIDHLFPHIPSTSCRGAKIGAARGEGQRTAPAPGRPHPPDRSAGEVDHHRLALGEALQHPLQRELAPDPRLLEAAVRHPGQLTEPAVHLHPARFDAVGRAQRPAQVPAPDVGGEPVVGVIGHPDRLLLVLPGNDDQDRSEDLLARDPPAVVDPGEHGGGDEVALRQRALAGRQAADRHPGRRLPQPILDVRADPLELPGVDDRAHVGGLVEGVPDLQPGQSLHQPGQEGVVDGAVQDWPWRVKRMPAITPSTVASSSESG